MTLPGAEPATLLAFWTGVTALVLCVLLLAGMLFLPLRRGVARMRRDKVLKRWRPLLMAGLQDVPEFLPQPSRYELPHVLALWNHLHASLDVEARHNLVQLAALMRLPAAVTRLLRGGGFSDRLLAIRSAGTLRLAGAWEMLREILNSDSPTLSCAAAEALLRIDTERGLPLLMPYLSDCENWPDASVSSLLPLAESGPLGHLLLEAIKNAPPDNARRLLGFLAEVDACAAEQAAGQYLGNTASDVDMLNACLDLLNTRQHVDVVHMLCRHENWLVRVHAAKALGRIGVPEDEALLTGMLDDSQWWVRYRAAQALANLPDIAAGQLLHIKDTRTNSEARDMLHQVMAENALPVVTVEQGHD